jgi:SAM-dependent methyltransferase
MRAHLSTLTRRQFGAVVLGATLAPATAFAQEPKLDVIYVPTPHEVVKRMLEMAGLKSGEFLIDLGCGDGRIVVAAARDFGARGFGVDINPVRIKEANENAQKAGVTDKVEFKIQDLFKTDISKADVLSLYLLTSINLRLRPVILDTMRPGSRVVSQSFAMGEWEADAKDTVRHSSVFLWHVPAKVAGRWQVEVEGQKFVLTLEQTFQKIKGSADMSGTAVTVSEANLKGADIDLTVGKWSLHGKVNGDRIESTGRLPWAASRLAS